MPKLFLLLCLFFALFTSRAAAPVSPVSVRLSEAFSTDISLKKADTLKEPAKKQSSAFKTFLSLIFISPLLLIPYGLAGLIFSWKLAMPVLLSGLGILLLILSAFFWLKYNPRYRRRRRRIQMA